MSKSIIKRFKKPTIDEVKEYCIERGNNINPEIFIDFYESNGWKVGKNSMKDWKASLRTWEKNSTNSNKSSKVENQIDSWQKARDIVNNS